MSQITRQPIATSKTESARPAAASAPGRNTSVLITEKQVAFSTAAAVSAEPRRRAWPVAALSARLGRMLTGLTEPRPHSLRHEPVYFEASRMSREMERL